MPSEPCRHLRKAFRLNEMVEGESREHRAVAVDVRFYEQSSASDAIKSYFPSRIATCVYDWSVSLV